MGLATAPLATLKLDERDRRRFRMRRLGWRGDGRTAGVASESLLAEDPERSTLHLPARERERDLDASPREDARLRGREPCLRRRDVDVDRRALCRCRLAARRAREVGLLARPVPRRRRLREYSLCVHDEPLLPSLHDSLGARDVRAVRRECRCRDRRGLASCRLPSSLSSLEAPLDGSSRLYRRRRRLRRRRCERRSSSVADALSLPDSERLLADARAARRRRRFHVGLPRRRRRSRATA